MEAHLSCNHRPWFGFRDRVGFARGRESCHNHGSHVDSHVLEGIVEAAMKLPPRKSTLFLSLFLFLHGGLIVLELDKIPTLQAIAGILAITAGVFFWIER